MSKINDGIFQKACLVQLASSSWNGQKMLPNSVMESMGNSDWIKGRKHLINPELLAPIKTTIQKARHLLMKTALPFPMQGLFLVPKDSILDVDGHLELIKAEFWNKVDTFQDFYAEARDEAKSVLGDLFQESDYPADIRSKFRLEWRFLLLDIPSKASILPPEVYAREKDKFRSMMEEAQTMALSALREEFGDIIHSLVDKLNAPADGKPKAIKSNFMLKLAEFLNSFQDRNIFNDEKLAELVEQSRSVLKTMRGGSLGYSLNYNEVLKQKVSTEMATLKDAIDAAIEEMPRRRIRMNDNETVPDQLLMAA